MMKRVWSEVLEWKTLTRRCSIQQQIFYFDGTAHVCRNRSPAPTEFSFFCSGMLVGRMGDDRGGSDVGEKYYNVHAFVFNSTYAALGGKTIEWKRKFPLKELFCESFWYFFYMPKRPCLWFIFVTSTRFLVSLFN